jgi:hypothetical protein
MTKRIHLLVGIILILAALACNVSEEASETATPPTADAANVTPQTSGGSDLPQTHTDSALGIAFDYPEGWRIEGNPGDLIQVLSPPGSGNSPRPQGDGFPEDETKIEFIASNPNNPYSNIDEWIAFSEQPSQGPGGDLLFADTLTLPSGISAARGAFGTELDGSENPVLVIEHDGRLIIITGFGDTARFDEVVNTIRPS